MRSYWPLHMNGRIAPPPALDPPLSRYHLDVLHSCSLTTNEALKCDGNLAGGTSDVSAWSRCQRRTCNVPGSWWSSAWWLESTTRSVASSQSSLTTIQARQLHSLYITRSSLNNSGVASNLRQRVRKVVFPSLPFPFHFPPPLSLPLLPFRSRPLKYSYGLEERCKLPSGVWSGAPAEIEFGVFVYFSLEIWNLVAPILLIFFRINWTECMHFQKSGTKKLCIFLTGGAYAYAPYALCMSTPLLNMHLHLNFVLIDRIMLEAKVKSM